MRTRIKICGVTDVATAAAAVDAGADAIGMIFHPPSSRHLELKQAATVAAAARAAGPFVATVAVLVNPAAAAVRAIIDAVAPTHLQFHAEESDAFCAGFGLPYIKALRVKSDSDLSAAAAKFPSARAILLDTHRAGVYGGSGETFDWRRARYAGDGHRKLILAGGLTVENVAAGIARVRPFAVDVSSGVEVDGEAGRKDSGKIHAFCRAVAAADATVTSESTVTGESTVTSESTVTGESTVTSESTVTGESTVTA